MCEGYRPNGREEKHLNIENSGDKDRRTAKGTAGEDIVMEAIRQAATVTGVQIRYFRNIIMEFPSLFGQRGIMTTEIDNIIVTPSRVILVEVKNEDLNVEWAFPDAKTWRLKNGDEVSNPINQNQFHKTVFCAEFGIRREDVVTAECVTSVPLYHVGGFRHYLPNQYLAGSDRIPDLFTLLLYEESFHPPVNRSDLCRKLYDLEAASAAKRARHIDNLRSFKRTSEWTRTHEKHYTFSLTDVGICPLCGGRLYFSEIMDVDQQRGNRRASRQYRIICENSRRNDAPCRYEARYAKGKSGQGFAEVPRITICERAGWEMEEEHRHTILDEYAEMKGQLRTLTRENEEQKRSIESLRHWSNEKDNEARRLSQKLEEAKTELSHFRHCFGRWFRKDA